MILTCINYCYFAGDVGYLIYSLVAWSSSNIIGHISEVTGTIQCPLSHVSTEMGNHSWVNHLAL